MPGPIGYNPPANTYSAMPIDPNSFHGTNPLPAMGAAQAAMAPAQGLIQKSQEFDSQAAQAAKFQKLLQSGQQGMQSYIQDVAKTNPELAAQFTQEFTTTAPFMQGLKGKELTDFAFNVYDSWNGRLGGAKVGSAMAANPDATMPELLGAAGGDISAKDKLTLKGTDDLRKSTIAKNAADIEYTKNKPGLQLRLQGMRDDSKLRAARIRASKDAKGAANFQYTYDDAKTSFEELAKPIQDLNEAMAKDPVMAKFEGNITMLTQLRRERAGWQKAMQHAVEKGAKPGSKTLITLPSGLDLGQPGSASASTPTSSAPTYQPPTITAQSSDSEIESFLRNYRDPDTGEKLVVTPDLVKRAREAKMKEASRAAP